VATASDEVVMTGEAATVMERDLVAVTPLASVTSTVKVLVEAEAPTVPLITPVRGSRLSPVGRLPVEMLQVTGEVPPDDAKV